MIRRGAIPAVLLAAVLMQACDRGPDGQSVRDDMQRALDGMEPGLLRIVGFNPQGSGPAVKPGELVVYANVSLELERGHDFGTWDGPAVGTLASALGATDKGIRGIKDGGNAAGERLRVYASGIYATGDDGWHYRGGGAPVLRGPAGAALAAPGEPIVAQIQAILTRMQANDDASRAKLLERSLTRALAEIQRQVTEAESGAIVAGGPAGGEYAAIAGGLERLFARRGTRLAVFHSDGSVENARLVHAGDVAFAIVQSDVLALARAGQGPFATAEPLIGIVALAALYPEPVHVIVPEDSPVRTIADLAGKRVALGGPESGTRYTAVRVLEAHGLRLDGLGKIDDSELETAAARLASGAVDAMFATIGAPSGALRRLASRRAIRLLPLDEAAIVGLLADGRGYVRHDIPRSTYRGQRESVPTIATTAVLVARPDADDDLVERALEVVFFELDYEAAGTLQGGMIAPRTATRGLTLPLHDAAQRFYAALPTQR